jgi:hypothetical protein
VAPRNIPPELRKVAYKPRQVTPGVKLGRKPATSWVTGPDPRRHKQYYAWMKHKAQAKYRQEPHELSFVEWEEIWNTDYHWENRGRALENVCLTRIDIEKPWSRDNCEIISRQEQLIRQNKCKLGTSYKPRKPRKDIGLKRPNYRRG